MKTDTTDQTLELIAQAQANPLGKAFSQPGSATTGLAVYDLEPAIRLMFPVNTPLRNKIPRLNGKGGIQANWRIFTSMQAGKTRSAIEEGKRNAAGAFTEVDYLSKYVGWGEDDSVTWEAGYAAQGFGTDPKVLAAKGTLLRSFIGEEKMIIGGNGTAVALGTPDAPTLALVDSKGTFSDATTYSVVVVALTFQAWHDTVGLNNGAIGLKPNPATAKVPGLVTRTNINGTTTTYNGGSSIPSGNTILTTKASQAIAATTTAISGAFGYAWYVGSAGAEKLVALTTINSAVITGPAAAGAQLASALPGTDMSKCSIEFDGLIYQAIKSYVSGVGGYVHSMPTGTAGTGTGLTSDGADGIVEINDALQTMFDVYGVSPSVMYVSSQEAKNITKKVVTNGGGGAALLRAVVSQGGENAINAGFRVTSYLNPFTGTQIRIETHRSMPAGTILLMAETLDYPLAEFGEYPARMLMRREYHQVTWAETDRSTQYGTYADGVLQHIAPWAMAVITNIANQ
ncbi:MAG: hypothetical protein HGB04_03970 [Chlorobiaceae bacterium]|nr:hypothetical protein [Chlorobiaceae bacterium]